MVYEGKLTVNDSTMTGNEADGGGAIYANYGEVTVTGSMLSDNEAYSGSAVDARYSTLTISDSRLIDNKGPGWLRRRGYLCDWRRRLRQPVGQGDDHRHDHHRQQQ